MISPQNEFQARIGLDNLFKFKQSRQPFTLGQGINESLSSQSEENDSNDHPLIIGQDILTKAANQQSVSQLKRKDKNSVHNDEYQSKKQGKKKQAQQSHIGQSQFLQNLQQTNIKSLNAGLNSLQDNIEEEIEKQENQVNHNEIQINRSLNNNNQINQHKGNKRISNKSESSSRFRNEKDENIEEENDIDVNFDQLSEKQEEKDDQDDDMDIDDQEEEEDNSDNDSESHEESIVKKKIQNTNITLTKSPSTKSTKNTRQQNKKPGRKGNQGRGKHNDSKGQHGSSSHHHGKRCNNQFCKFPYKGDLKRVKIKYTSEYVHLCSKCTERFKEKCYCQYCGQVYYDSNEGDGKLWIQCEDCLFWLHQECEKDNGLSDIDSLIEDESYKFQCLRCRDKNKAIQQDKLQMNIQKSQIQLQKTLQSLNGGNNDINNLQSNTSSTSNDVEANDNSPTQSKQNKKLCKKLNKDKNQSNTDKNKGKVSLASLQKQLTKPIFVPKPNQVDLYNGIKKNSANANLNEQTTEPKKQKKVCNEESKSQNPSQSQTKQSPQNNQIQSGNNINHHTNQSNNSNEYYSASLFLKAKKLSQQSTTEQNFNSPQISCKKQFNYLNSHENHCDSGLHDNHNQNIQSPAINPYSHHQRQRKENQLNYIELPYKKQTLKENTSKRIFYHYSVLQELLTPLSLSMTLDQQDINEDLQILRSIILDGGRRVKDEDGSYSQQNSHLDDYSANQVNMSQSSQFDSFHNKQSPQQINGEIAEFFNITPIKKKVLSDDNHAKQFIGHSPFISHI